MVGRHDWSGEILSVQPRIRLTRAFDERALSYFGYVLRIRGELNDEDREFAVAIGKAAQEKHGYPVGDRASGKGVPVADPRLETAELYKISSLKLLAPGQNRRTVLPRSWTWPHKPRF